MSTVLLIEAALCRGSASGQGQAFGGVRRGAFPRDGKHAALPGGLDEASGREKPQKNYGCPAGRWMHRPSAAAQASIKASE